MPPTPPSQPRIAILGAGPAGLSTAWFLKKLGYTDVLVLEKLGRIGGLACTINSGYKAFDLGANYITPAYWETWKLAWAVGARTYKASVYSEAIERDDGFEYRPMTEYVRTDPNDPTKQVSLWRLGRAALKYFRLRLGVRKWIDRPDFGRVAERADLCVSFEVWLDRNDLGVLKRMFQVPITMMGYGFLDEIATPYALKYLSPGSFLNLVLRGLPLIGDAFPFPRRFSEGFQRVWQKLSWKLDVRENVDVKCIERDSSESRPIKIKFEHPDQILNQQHGVPQELCFDHLVIACPLTEDVLHEFMTLSEEETALFNTGTVDTYHFCHATVRAAKKGTDQPFRMKYPVLCCTPFIEETIGRPWAAVQLFPEDTSLIQFYVRVIPEEKDPKWKAVLEDPRWIAMLDLMHKEHKLATGRECETLAFRELVLERIEEFLNKMGAESAGATDSVNKRWVSYARWPYFGHVTSAVIAGGYYTRLEELQGTDNTWYAGGVTNFELIEPIVCYAKALAGRIDDRVRQDAQREGSDGRA